MRCGMDEIDFRASHHSFCANSQALLGSKTAGESARDYEVKKLADNDGFVDSRQFYRQHWPAMPSHTPEPHRPEYQDFQRIRHSFHRDLRSRALPQPLRLLARALLPLRLELLRPDHCLSVHLRRVLPRRPHLDPRPPHPTCLPRAPAVPPGPRAADHHGRAARRPAHRRPGVCHPGHGVHRLRGGRPGYFRREVARPLRQLRQFPLHGFRAADCWRVEAQRGGGQGPKVRRQ
mmetsp:Transcript_2443/g.6657  ORF Transcript_2443/g.6657 Transcript_2443/m.6657 type:complete len:233 (-) Transcript_2443:1283-1981(-)